jgi:transcriptional regulator with XRE-family HTH domain
MTISFDEIGNRLKAFRLASGMSADEVAKRIGISRTALYRFEKGELAKIETLERLSELLEVSVPTLLGVGVEYIASAVAFFERIRQIEAASDHITVLAGPVSYLMASDAFDETLEDVLRESIPGEAEDRRGILRQLGELMTILRQRRAAYAENRPGVLNLISGAEIDRFLRNGLVGRLDLEPDILAARRARARDEARHLAGLMEEQPIGVQIGIVPGALPHTSFQIFRDRDRRTLALSPFRLGEQPNIHAGIAMITSAEEALSLHEQAVGDMWRRALKGPEAAKFLRDLIDRNR